MPNARPYERDSRGHLVRRREEDPKIDWPAIPVRVPPSLIDELAVQMRRLKLNRGAWARDVLIKAAGELRKRKTPKED